MTLAELVERLDEYGLVILDVRSRLEFSGEGGYPCDPRQGSIPGARHVELGDLMARAPEELPELLGVAPGAEVVCYCHSGQRSSLAVAALRAGGYRARNYVGSWHEWSRHEELPVR